MCASQSSLLSSLDSFAQMVFGPETIPNDFMVREID